MLQRETIEKFFPTVQIGKLTYFGLPSSSLGDISEWRDLFGEFIAVERGEHDREWELQHDLALEAFRLGLLDKLKILRGDIDAMIRTGKDPFRRKIRFPFDVVSLDYSGGLFYKDATGAFGRLKAISALLERQHQFKRNFVLLVSCNLDSIDQGEIRITLENLQTELVRYGETGRRVIDAYLAHEQEECRLKLYVPFFVNKEAAKNHYNCQTSKPIFYQGNRTVRMMAFRFELSYDDRTESLREPKERLSQIINQPLIEVIEGERTETTLNLPKLEPQR